MYEFSGMKEEPEPQASGRRFGPPRKHTGVSLLDPRSWRGSKLHESRSTESWLGCGKPVSVAITHVGPYMDRRAFQRGATVLKDGAKPRGAVQNGVEWPATSFGCDYSRTASFLA
jgi:hypothetical protein